MAVWEMTTKQLWFELRGLGGFQPLTLKLRRLEILVELQARYAKETTEC